MPRAFLVVTLFFAACGSMPLPEDGGATHLDDAGATLDAGEPPSDAGTTDAGTPLPDAGPVPCPADQICVSSFVFTDDNDTSTATRDQFDTYNCAPTINEGGREVVYRVDVPAAGFLSAAVTEAQGVDVDVHILSSLDTQHCIARGNFHARADVTPGTFYVVVDTFVSGGVPQQGAYRLDIGFLRPSQGACAMQTGVMPRVGDNGNSLAMPATGPMVLEAHLVTQEEPPPYPTTATDQLAAHYALSQARTGLVMHRTQPWAPLEGGTFYGAGIGSPTLFPVEHEGWYVNMYWTSAARPPRGTKMILRAGTALRAVVVAAGYETGPGNLSFIGGTPEESHFYLFTDHGSVMTLGIAVDQSIPYGPRECAP